MSRRFSWVARGPLVDVKGASMPTPWDVLPISAVVRDLESLLSARLTALGFAGIPRPGVRSYSALFGRGSQSLPIIVTLETEPENIASHPGPVMRA